LDITWVCTVAVIMQYLDVRGRVSGIVLNPDVPDHLIWRPTASGQYYSVSSAYTDLFHGQTVILGAKELWKTQSPPEVVLLPVAGHPREVLDLREASTSRAEGRQLLCALFSWGGNRRSPVCWLRTQPRGLATNAASLQLTGTYPIPGGSIVDCSKKEGAEGNERRKAFVSVFALVSWSLWLERNARVFNDRGTSASVLADLIWAQVDLWCPTRLIIGRTWQESGVFSLRVVLLEDYPPCTLSPSVRTHNLEKNVLLHLSIPGW
jgi:hypothetical protein